MFGILSYGAYVPMFRLSRDQIAKAWGGGSGAGEKAVANFDEDSLTMGVEAAVDCLQGIDHKSIDALYFVSLTHPYQEKQAASIIAEVLDLKPDTFTLDIDNSPRGATSAFRLAADAIASGSAKKVLVIASDCRVTAPHSGDEMLFGDGAAAFLLGDAKPAVTIDNAYHAFNSFMDTWRLPNEPFNRTWEDRFIFGEGYSKIAPQAVAAALKQFKATIKDFAKVVLYAPDQRRHTELARALGVDAKTQLQEAFFNNIGHTGSAFVPMMLVAALQEAKAGDKILTFNYGDGCDVHALTVTAGIEKLRNRRGIKKYLASKLPVSYYQQYLIFRDLVIEEPGGRATRTSSLPVLWRERKNLVSLIGQKCRVCGTVNFPLQRLCIECQTEGEFDDYPIWDKKGKIFTFSMDERTVQPVAPSVACIMDLEGGGRFYGNITDRDPATIDVGQEVEFTFRNIHDGGGLHNYFWKMRTVRG
ncbi:MAG: 3-hydroxy-3-methylglutaryl CoA synthase [Chloroflexi bacterium]|nr:3-hydroxy-3-methylglutaryl CoA synthase [Chloroflexota bacterium]